MFGRKRAAKPAEPEEDAPEESAGPPAAVDEEDEAAAKAAAPPPKSGGLLKTIIGLAVVTVVAAGGGVGLGLQTGASIERAIAARDALAPAANSLTVKYAGDTVVKTIEPVITNLSSPADTWVRLETAMIFKNGTLANPEVTAAQIRQDEVAYLRTISITQLEGPSALQHLREDLNERASLRTGGKVTELVIQTLIVQ
jgi:flagellar FliL protein